MGLISLTLFLFACIGDDNDIYRENPYGQSGVTVSSSSDELLDFTIEFDEADEETYGNMEETVITDPSADGYEDFIENHTFSTTIAVVYNGTTATLSSLPSGVTVTQDGAHIIVQSSISGVEYVLTGSSEDGSFKVYSNDDFRLSLDGVSLHNPAGAAINIQSSVLAFVMAEEGTDNQLTDGEDYETVDGEDMKACLFSEGGLIFGGTGSLSVTGNHNHAITSDDHIRFRSGCNITVENAANDGIHTNDQITIGGGIIYVTSQGDCIQCGDEGIEMTGGFIHLSTSGDGSDGLKAETALTLSGGAAQVEINGAAGKGVKCESFAMTDGKLTIINYADAIYDEDDADISSPAGIKCDGDIVISGGQIGLLSTGAAGKGINCDGSLSITSGTVQVQTTGQQYIYGQLDSSAKGIKADGDITISGDAIVQVKATGGEGSEGIESKSVLYVTGGQVASYCYDDAMNASDAIEISGGTVYCHSTGNDGIDSNGTLTISGGLTIAIGTSAPEGGIDCDQNTFAITGGTLLGIGGESSTPTESACTQPSFLYSGSANSGELIHVAAADGTDVLTFEFPQSYSSMTLLFSSPSLEQGGTYTLYTGGSVSGGTEFFGYYTDAEYTEGSEEDSFTLSSMVTNLGRSSGGFGRW